MNAAPVHGEVAEWVRASWSEDLTLREWWRRLADAGLSQPSWPEPYGRSYSAADARAATDQLAAAGTIAAPEGGVGAALAGPTLLEHGTAAQQRRYLPPLLRGEESWCQLFSEPGAGSDLPSLSTRATQGRRRLGRARAEGVELQRAPRPARAAAGAARTRRDPGRGGISYFVLDMAQPGVEVRPIRQMDGRSAFCEVFLDGASCATTTSSAGRTTAGGWRVRRSPTSGRTRRGVRARGLVSVVAGELEGNLDRDVRSLLAAAREQAGFKRRAIPVADLVELARGRGPS